MDEQLWNLVKKTVVRDGFFVGLEKLRQEGKLSPADVGAVRVSLFGYLAARVEESQKEAQRIQAVLVRLKAICDEGKRKAPVQLVFTGPVNRVGDELRALDGWVV